MINQTHFDAIVVGAGPGGASTAHDLAKAGARTLLLDKQKLPRHKTCGGGVTHKVTTILPFDIAPVVERTISTVVFSYQMASANSWAGASLCAHATKRTP